MLDFESLLANPPLKTTSITLEDGRKVKIHELPVFVIEDVQDIGQHNSGNIRLVMEEVVRVVAHSLLGRIPTPEELGRVRETFGISTVMFIYYEALKFSRLGSNSLDETKKH